jgi:hypothetical protein
VLESFDRIIQRASKAAVDTFSFSSFVMLHIWLIILGSESPQVELEVKHAIIRMLNISSLICQFVSLRNGYTSPTIFFEPSAVESA